MTNNTKSHRGSVPASRGLAKVWHNLAEDEKNIFIAFAFAVKPVTLDTLTALTGQSALNILNFMETLCKKRIVLESKAHGKGVYLLKNGALSAFIESTLPKTEKQKVIQNLLTFYNESHRTGPEKDRILADLYLQLDDITPGLEFIKRTADALSRLGEKEKARAYYQRIISRFSKSRPNLKEAGVYLESILEKVALTIQSVPPEQTISILNKGKKIVAYYEMTEFMVRIDLKLGWALLVAGRPKEAGRLFLACQKRSKETGDKDTRRAATIMVSHHYLTQGRISRAIANYEASLGSLEAFQNDEVALEATALLGYCYVLSGKIARGMGMIDTVKRKAEKLGLSRTAVAARYLGIISQFDIRKIQDTQPFIEKLCETANIDPGHMISSGINCCRAYMLCMEGNYGEAYKHIEKAAEHSGFYGLHHYYSWVLECLDALEGAGFVHEGMNFNSEINEMLSSDDIYRKGVALRYRALRHMERHISRAGVLQDLKNSEKNLQEAGGEIELARTRVALAFYYSQREDWGKAQSYAAKAREAFLTVDRELFPKDLLDILPSTEKVSLLVDRTTKLNETLGTITDKDTFLKKALAVAIDFTFTARGFFLVSDRGNLRLAVSRNMDLSSLESDGLNQLSDHITETAQGNKEILIQAASADEPFHHFLQTLGIRSIICIPVKLGDIIEGYLLLENRMGKKTFSNEQLLFARMICSQIALGLANIRICDEIREQKNRFEEEALFYKKEMWVKDPITDIVGHSKEISAVIRQIEQVAPTDSSVLIMGETGTGKDLAARAIHSLSGRRQGPFIPVNLATLPPDLVASELFGHEKGAFTGAHEKLKGRFELADGGILFLDEIGDLPLSIQLKLLRVLQEGTFERLGGTQPIHSNFRIIAATNKNLLHETEKGTFRQDLYYRLNVFPIIMPPLRNRLDDVAPLANHFLKKYCQNLGKRIERIPPEEVKKLECYHWPGNVRELQHAVERAVIISDGHTITFSGLTLEPDRTRREADEPPQSLAEVEKQHIERILQRTRGRIGGPAGAARILGLKRTTLMARMKKHGISGPGRKDIQIK